MQDEKIAQVLKIIDFQLETLNSMESLSKSTLHPWRDRTARVLSGLVLAEEIKIFKEISSSSWAGDKRLFGDFLTTLKAGIQQLPAIYLEPETLIAFEDKFAKSETKDLPQDKNDSTLQNRVFIVHGHDDLVKVTVARLIEKMGIETIILHEQPNKGKTVIEKFEQNASLARFAVVILTPDDMGHSIKTPDDKHPRARQNVILELGYFIGSLGRDKVFVLRKGDIEIPSDYLGVVYVEYDDAGAWKLELVKEMKLAGIEVDLNKL